MRQSFHRLAALAGLVSITLVGAGSAQAQQARAAIQEQSGIEAAAEQSQKRINNLDDEAQRLLAEYRLTTSEADSLRRYNEALAKQIKSQQEEMVSMQQQIVQIEHTNREILPHIARLLETLDQFVKLDMPFLPDERNKRMATLREMMDRADVSTAEKYRRILEAYQVEMEYGRTIEAYQGKMGEGEDARTVDFLRLGRVALLYQTLDGSDTGYWDADQKAWEEDNGYRDEVKAGLKIAKKQSAPDLLVAPIHAPVAAQPEAKP